MNYVKRKSEEEEEEGKKSETGKRKEKLELMSVGKKVGWASAWSAAEDSHESQEPEEYNMRRILCAAHAAWLGAGRDYYSSINSP